jgi:glycosyltransferase EpsE
MAPRVTVLMSVYNGEGFFDRAIPSILAQSYADFELLIIDDGSTDRTPGLLREAAAKDPRVRILSPGRLGFARALNHGLAEARGEYIARHDFDDTSAATRLEEQVAFLDARPEVGLVGGWYVVEDTNRGERYVRKQPLEHDAIVATMARAIPFAHSLVTLRREALVAAGGIAEVRNITDLRTWVRVAELGWKLANIPEVIGTHYVYSQSQFHQAMRYHKRQRELAWVQAQAVLRLRMPVWRLAFPVARLFYSYLPTGLKRFARRRLAGSREEDLQ